MKINKIFIIISLAIIFLSSIHSSSAVLLVVDKVEIIYEGVLKNGYAEDTVMVGTDSPDNITIDYIREGDIKDWISFRPNTTLVINNNNRAAMTIIIQPPADVQAGNYTGGVRIITGTLNKPGAPYGSAIQAAFFIKIHLEVTGKEKISCVASGFNFQDTEIGYPVEFDATVLNQGNVRIKPNITIDVWNQYQTKLMMSKEFFITQDILPTTQYAFMENIQNTLPLGQYWVDINVPLCQGSALQTFNIVEKGAISDQGELVRIDNNPWAKTGEIVPITAVFRNNGQRTVSARFKGTVVSDNKIYSTLETDFLDVKPGETAKFQTFFTPPYTGQYLISGRVLYNNKLTYEKNSMLNVEQGAAANNTWMIILAVAIVVAILILLIMIRRRKIKGRAY